MARPIRTAYSNLVLVGPPGTEGRVFDLHATRAPDGGIQSVWLLEPAERAAIAEGANIVLEVYTDQHPAVSVAVAKVDEAEGEWTQAALERAAMLTRQRIESENPSCASCGGITQRTGACYTCTTCGTSTGCG